MKLAIVGSGIAGLGLAYYLRDKYDITIYEQNDYAGGHSNTVSIPENGIDLPIDTGFMVFNFATYPNLKRLFEDLMVPIKKTDMSFSVQHRASRLEFAGADFNRLFGDRTNLFNLRYWKMLLQLDRFNKEAIVSMNSPDVAGMTLREYVEARNYGSDLLEYYIIPMSSAIWSTPRSKMLEFPALTLLRFFHNHGFLGMDTQHQWWTVAGGAREYVSRLIRRLDRPPVLRARVLSVQREKRHVTVNASDGSRTRFDKVAFACHADQALELLEEPSGLERELLGAFGYEKNIASVHIDASIMPKERRCWASWNYRVEASGEKASTHYWMNSLQGVSKKRDYFVSINAEDLIDPKRVLKTITYHHPVFSMPAVKAQARLPELNSSPQQQVYFCGSYFRYGFHEDALSSSLQLSQILAEASVCV